MPLTHKTLLSLLQELVKHTVAPRLRLGVASAVAKLRPPIKMVEPEHVGMLNDLRLVGAGGS
jgi:hypothetical protein